MAPIGSTNITAPPPLRGELDTCPVCGNSQFARQPILWEKLIREWELSPAEADYIDLQQGLSCTSCRNNLRSMTLAAAICRAFACTVPLDSACRHDATLRTLTVLEINRAGGLTPTLRLLPGHQLREFPEFDMQDMKCASDSVDVIVHSDTLEHVPDSRAALCECLRVLKPGGHLFYTVPILAGRLTRTRMGLSPSYHGNIESEHEDIRVQREYGADFWCELLQAGFNNLTLTTMIFPASIVVSAVKS